MYPNGLHPEERRLQALWIARDLTEGKQDPTATLKAAEQIDAFVRGESQAARPALTVIRT